MRDAVQRMLTGVSADLVVLSRLPAVQVIALAWFGLTYYDIHVGLDLDSEGFTVALAPGTLVMVSSAGMILLIVVGALLAGTDQVAVRLVGSSRTLVGVVHLVTLLLTVVGANLVSVAMGAYATWMQGASLSRLGVALVFSIWHCFWWAAVAYGVTLVSRSAVAGIVGTSLGFVLLMVEPVATRLPSSPYGLGAGLTQSAIDGFTGAWVTNAPVPPSIASAMAGLAAYTIGVVVVVGVVMRRRDA